MPITYYDKLVRDPGHKVHPALDINTMSPYYRMERFGGLLDGLSDEITTVSTFRWTEAQACVMYTWYVQDYNSSDIIDEFGEDIDRYKWTRIIKKAHYLDEFGNVSKLTIQQMYEAKIEAQLEAKLGAQINTADIPYKG